MKMAQIIIFNQSNPQIGYIARTSTKGEEFDMVNQYIKSIIGHYKKLKKKKAAIFIEPQIETGYPDIVIAEFYSSFKYKNRYRETLKVEDLKILYHILQKKKTSVVQISEELGFSLDETKKSIKRLNLANMVQLTGNNQYVKNVPLKNFYKINKIISIEAKLDKWSEALRQAENNIWFSSESFIMLNKTKCNDSIRKKCIESGIGVILVNGKTQIYLKGHLRKLPVSYASFQFNEWIYKITSGKLEEINS